MEELKINLYNKTYNKLRMKYPYKVSQGYLAYPSFIFLYNPVNDWGNNNLYLPFKFEDVEITLELLY